MVSISLDEILREENHKGSSYPLLPIALYDFSYQHLL